jgi:biopolymer transport protein ExbB
VSGPIWYSFERGGAVMIPLALCCCLLWYGLSYRVILLRRGTRQSVRQLWQQAHRGELCGDRFGVLPRAARSAAAALRDAESFSRERLTVLFFVLEQSLHRYASLVRVVVVIAPLLGLLGTVLGMIEMFQSLEQLSLYHQSGGIAGGIAQALITTEMGLVVAVPGLLGARLLDKKEDALLQELEQLKQCLAAQRPVK